MASSLQGVVHAVPDASLVAKWHTPAEPGWEHAQVYLAALIAGTLRLTAPEHLKVEVIRVLQMGVRDKRYTVEEGIARVEAFRTLPITYVANDLLFVDAFRSASRFLMALYDALYLALADALETPFVTADRRLVNLARQRGIDRIALFEDFDPSNKADE